MRPRNSKAISFRLQSRPCAAALEELQQFRGKEGRLNAPLPLSGSHTCVCDEVDEHDVNHTRENRQATHVNVI